MQNEYSRNCWQLEQLGGAAQGRVLPREGRLSLLPICPKPRDQISFLEETDNSDFIDSKDYGADFVAQIKLMTMTQASHAGASSSPGYSTSDLATCY